MTKKGKTVEAISICVLQLEIAKGHLKWKVTDLESRANVSRSLVYRYLGSTKEEILRNALRLFTESFYGFSEDGLSIPFPERVRRTRDFLIAHPEAIQFYQKWRALDTWVSRELMRAEEKFQRKLKKLYPALNELQVFMVHGFLHGLVTAPFLTGDQSLECAQELERLMTR